MYRYNMPPSFLLTLLTCRMGVTLGFLHVGALFGTLAAPYLKTISYTFTLAVCAFGGVIPFLYILIFLKESVVFTKVTND